MMTDDLRDDPLLHALSGLPCPEPDPIRAASVRARCHSALSRRTARQWPGSFAGALCRRVLEPALVGGACALYLAEVIRRAAALFGF